jgi:hypothetical protein
MFMKKSFIAFCAALLMMLQCCIAGASELKEEPEMELSNERTWDIRKAQYTLFAKPPVGWVGDVMPMVGDEESGELRLFYLAKRKLTEKLGSTNVSISAWQDEINQCERARNALYDEYRPQHELLMQLCKIKSHINNMQRSLTGQIEKTHQYDRT